MQLEVKELNVIAPVNSGNDDAGSGPAAGGKKDSKEGCCDCKTTKDLSYEMAGALFDQKRW